jgi:hypothetical protein
MKRHTLSIDARFRRRAVLPALVLAATVPAAAVAHDSWMSREEFRDPASHEWCCDEHDCTVLDEADVRMTRKGFIVFGKYTVSQQRVLPSSDGHYWACMNGVPRSPHAKDPGVRCFFAPFDV